jgi:opacity protein-like surface antigen
MRVQPSIVVGVLLVTVLTGVASAQTTHRPSRPYRGLFGGGATPDPQRIRTDFTLTASAGGGYDDYLTPEGSSPGASGESRQSGLVGSTDALLNYFHGRATKFVSIDGHSFSNAYSGLNPTVGGEARIRLVDTLGRRSQLSVSQDVTYRPLFILGAFDSLNPDVPVEDLPDATGHPGLTEQRSISNSTALNLESRWSTHHRTGVNYSFSQRRYIDSFGYDGRTHLASGRHDWVFARRFSLQSSYRFSDTLLTQDDGLRTPLTENTVDVGFSYARRLSRTREIQLSGGGGATHVDTLNPVDRAPSAYWLPSARGQVRMEIGRSWSIAADYDHDVNVLQGISLQTFAASTASVRTDGTIGRHIESSFSAAFSTGRAGQPEESGKYSSYGGTAQVRYAFSRSIALSLTYDYYNYRVEGLSDLPTGLPAQYDRNTIRLGLTFWLPFYGTYLHQPGR